VVPVSDELDDYEEGIERVEAWEEELEQELGLADAQELADCEAEPDDTPFDETRVEYSGVDEGGGGVDWKEMNEAGARLDDPERAARRRDS
jgi:hypothetical protein